MTRTAPDLHERLSVGEDHVSNQPALTRRERRERENASREATEAQTQRQQSRSVTPRQSSRAPVRSGPIFASPAVSPARIPEPVVRPVPRVDSGTKRPTRHRTSRSIAATAMVFVAAIAVATTVPASAFSPFSSVTTVNSAAVAAFDEQALTTASGGAVDVSRDNYGVSSFKKTAVAGYATAPTFTNNPRGTIQWPFPVGVRLSDDFGYRVAPCGGCSTDHKGQDFDAGTGAPIQIIADGVVRLVHSTDNGGLGVYVTVDHVINGQKVTSIYGHMITGSISVTEGQTVKVGQIVGNVGDTGASTGAHLHLEIHLNGAPVDPLAWLRANAN